MKELRTEIEIKAPPEKVWEILTDLARYPEWNPFFHHAVGTLKVGGEGGHHVPTRLQGYEAALHGHQSASEPPAILEVPRHLPLFMERSAQLHHRPAGG